MCAWPLGKLPKIICSSHNFALILSCTYCQQLKEPYISLWTTRLHVYTGIPVYVLLVILSIDFYLLFYTEHMIVLFCFVEVLLNWWKGKPSGSIACTWKQQPRFYWSCSSAVMNDATPLYVYAMTCFVSK